MILSLGRPLIIALVIGLSGAFDDGVRIPRLIPLFKVSPDLNAMDSSSNRHLAFVVDRD